MDEFWGGPWGHPWSLFKFAVLSRVSRVPFLFVSVGKCSLEHPLSRVFARSALKMAVYRSYREHDSKAAVQELLRSPHDPVYPDLAYSYSSPSLLTLCGRPAQDKCEVVGVSPIAFCDPRLWPLKDEQRYRRYLRELAETVKWLIEERHRVLLFATDSPDVLTIADLRAMIPECFTVGGLVEVVPAPPYQTVEGLLQLIAGMDLVIASRLHGVLLSHLMAVPVLAISYDRKVDVHMNEIGQMEHCVNFDRMDTRMLIERFRALGAVRARESAHLTRMVQGYRDQLEAQYDRLLGPVSPDCRVQHQQPQLITTLES
jgi:polysaccharide pyruvyl transferase WcaK-like protein